MARRSPVGAVLVGCGGIATSAHLPAMQALAGEVRLVGVMDVRLEAAEAVGRQWGVPAFGRLDQALEVPGAEAAVVCTPEAHHLEAVRAAAERGLHILCEKPMARTLAEADAMIDAARRTGVTLMIGHSRRFTARYQEVRRAILAGDVGEVRLVRENERRPRPRRGRGGADGYWSPGHWTGDPSLSDGAVLTNGVHEADLGNWLVGRRPLSVSAEARVTRPGGTVPDFISFVVRYEGGAIAASEVNNAAPPGYPAFHEMDVFGTAGAIRAHDSDTRLVERFGPAGSERPAAYGHLLHVQDAYTAEHAAFLRSVRGEAAPAVAPQEARLALAVALAAAASARTGAPAAVDSGPAGGGPP